MKSLHRSDLFAWSSFDRDRNIDFNSIAWIRPEGNILIDPLPLSDHDWQHLQQLGGAAWILITNSDHIRDAEAIANRTSAKIAAPRAEQPNFAINCDRWLGDGEEVVKGLLAIELHGSKTPGELAFLLEETTLITGDLVRAHQPNKLMLLPDAKIKDKSAALESVKRLARLSQIETVLVGDGWSIFERGHQHLEQLANA